MVEYDPRLVAPTCLYLASKAEESTVQARLLVFYMKKLSKLLLLKSEHVIHFLQKVIVDIQFKVWSAKTSLFGVTDADEKYRYEIKDILEMEMKILEAINYYLVVFHPYRSLSQ